MLIHMIDEKIIIIPKNLKHTEEHFKYESYNIKLPSYVRSSIKRYRFIQKNTKLYLQRQCIDCNNFFTVQIFDKDVFVNIQESEIEFTGEKTGFKSRCKTCNFDHQNNKDLKTTNVIKNITRTNDAEVQLNMTIDKELKKYFQILALQNDISLKVQIINALEFYKKHLPNKL